MEIKQLEPKEKIITFFGEIKNTTVEAAIKDIAKINANDLDYSEKCRQWAIENHQPYSSRQSGFTFPQVEERAMTAWLSTMWLRLHERQ